MPNYEYAVHRCTYDKLKDYLLDLGSDGWRVTPHFVGGRDWVLVSERGVPDIRLDGSAVTRQAVIDRFNLKDPA